MHSRLVGQTSLPKIIYLLLHWACANGHPEVVTNYHCQEATLYTLSTIHALVGIGLECDPNNLCNFSKLDN